MSRVSIEAHNLNKIIGAKVILDDVSFGIHHGEKTALVGLNGCGKSTLIKILAGIDSDYTGSVNLIPGNARIGYLPQWIEFPSVTIDSILDEALDEAGITQLWERDMVKSRVRDDVKLAGLNPDSFADKLSGGEKTRLYLACLLISEPDFLLLDEPTNFLDIAGLRWMEEFLRRIPQGVLMVSHDRHLIDKAADRVIELEDGKINDYPGNYSFYKAEKRAARERQNEEFRLQRLEIRRLKTLAAREKGFAKRAAKGPPPDKGSGTTDWGYIGAKAAKHDKKAKAIEKRIERMDKVERPRRNYMANIRFEGSVSSRIVARVENISKSFGVRILYKNVSFAVMAGEKVGILGANGSGKTVLLKILTGLEKPDEGTAFLIDSSRAGYFSQVFEGLNPELSAVEQVMHITGMNLWDSRQMLAFFMFFGEDVFKRTADLSIGEKSRLALACIRASNPEAIILDEPTNHLDVSTAEILENALGDYPGTIIIVTHDRFLLDALIKRLLIVENGEIISYPGNYSEWEQNNGKN
jgi:ATPase subunit of ABC transporter with duplicated ATPase domains